MPMKNFDALLESVSSLPEKTVAVAAAHDAHTLEALQLAKAKAPMRFALIGDPGEIKRIADSIAFPVKDSDIIASNDDAESAKKAVGLVREGGAQALMKGRLQTAALLKAVLDKETGIRTGGVMSHVAFMESPAYHKLFVVSDAAMLTHPDLAQKEQIARNAIEFLHAMGCERPKAAALCAVETVSPRMPETEDAKKLAEMAKAGAFGECILEGPISMDISLSAEIAKIKGFESQIAGDADIFLMPEIAAGNIMSKALLLLGGAKMAGCVLGAKAPIILVSRGATAEEKYLSIVLALSAKA